MKYFNLPKNKTGFDRLQLTENGSLALWYDNSSTSQFVEPVVITEQGITCPLKGPVIVFDQKNSVEGGVQK